MSEKKLYQDFKKNWTNFIERIEPKNEIGIPDVHMVNSEKDDIFLELKYLPSVFKCATMPIKATQFIWFANYKGRNAYMLFQVADSYFLFERQQVINLRGRIDFDRFSRLALVESESLKSIADYLDAKGSL